MRHSYSKRAGYKFERHVFDCIDCKIVEDNRGLNWIQEEKEIDGAGYLLRTGERDGDQRDAL